MTLLDVERRERDEFLEHVRRVTAPSGVLPGFFQGDRPIALARAPGRLDLLGGIADYSGSLVLELPLREAAFVAAQLSGEPGVRCASVGFEGEPVRVAELPSEALTQGYASAHALFRERPRDAWAAYLAGSLVALCADHGLCVSSGVRLLVASRVPEGKGLGSSAALEVAALFALARAARVEIDAHAGALLCQRAENRVVGAPCGVMDPMTAALGETGKLLELLCQPAQVLGQRALPAELACFGIDSGVRHAVTGAEYAEVRVAAFMGYRLLAEAAGLRVTRTETPGVVTIADPRWHGQLANVTPSELRGGLGDALPEQLSGAEFLAHYAGTTDRVAAIDPERSYPVRAATWHPIEEHHRVRVFAELLRAPSTPRTAGLLGELLYQAHAGYSACGLGSPWTDELVRLVRASNPALGLYGAKVTGGGSGGTVAILGRADALGAVEALAERYRRASGRGGAVLSGSSAGAAQLGSVLVGLERPG